MAGENCSVLDRFESSWRSEESCQLSHLEEVRRDTKNLIYNKGRGEAFQREPQSSPGWQVKTVQSWIELSRAVGESPHMEAVRSESGNFKCEYLSVQFCTGHFFLDLLLILQGGFFTGPPRFD